MPRRHYEVKDRLDEVQRAKDRLEEEAGTLRARVEAGQDNDGTHERLANVQRGTERKDIEDAELRAEWSEAIGESLARGELQTESATDFDSSRQSREPVGQQPRAPDGAMRTIERHVQGGNLTPPGVGAVCIPCHAAANPGSPRPGRLSRRPDRRGTDAQDDLPLCHFGPA